MTAVVQVLPKYSGWSLVTSVSHNGSVVHRRERRYGYRWRAERVARRYRRHFTSIGITCK